MGCLFLPEVQLSGFYPDDSTLEKRTSMNLNEGESCSVMSNSLEPHGLYNSPWNPPGQNTGVGSLSLLQGIFRTQGSNPSLPHCSWILYQLSHKKSPTMLSLGSLSLLQWIFLTQESNQGQGLLHCRWILYQLGYQGRPHSWTEEFTSMQWTFPALILERNLWGYGPSHMHWVSYWC